MTQEELNYIKDAFSQIIDDIAGNPDWYEAARAVASDLGTLERELGKKIAFPPSDFDEADLDALVNETFNKYSSVDGYGQLSVSFNRAELYSFIKKITRKEE